MNRTVIYKIECVATGKCYVGSTSDFYIRWYNHRHELNRGVHHCQRLQNAWSKYGPLSFKFIVLEYCENKVEVLLAREQYWMGVIKPFFNINPAAGSRLGIKASEETRKRISIALAGKRKSIEHKAKLSLANTGHVRSEESKKKQSITMTGRVLSEAHRINMGLSHKGSKRTPEQRAKISRARMGQGAIPVIGTNIVSGLETKYASSKAAEVDGFDRTGIAHCLHGRFKTHRGCTWRRA